MVEIGSKEAKAEFWQALGWFVVGLVAIAAFIGVNGVAG